MKSLLIKNLKFLSLILIACCICCEKEPVEELPICLQDTVSYVLERPVQDPRASIEKWKYKNEEVYLIAAMNFPDGESFVVTLDCKTTICSFGGFDGPQNDCENWEDATFIKTIWVDKR
ncbi:DUF6970 domain-containing protein [Leeuwenhoekiella sp. H156]|uniref:DUF6970 domain-containing protein n=1 Tax=Leeuwenhoekiella sp. H156 TaxID=3450128 RepID=UPI003FA49669